MKLPKFLQVACVILAALSGLCGLVYLDGYREQQLAYDVFGPDVNVVTRGGRVVAVYHHGGSSSRMISAIRSISGPFFSTMGLHDPFSYLDHATSCEVVQVSPKVAQLTALESISLPFCHKVSLPPEIGHLTRLKELRVGGGLTTLPAEIGQLKNLERLHLINNDLYELPPELFSLKRLHLLGLSVNNLHTIPAEIGNLVHLETLSIDEDITTLPAEIGKLSKLKDLRVVSGKLTSLPPEIGQLAKLQALDIVSSDKAFNGWAGGNFSMYLGVAYTETYTLSDHLTLIPPEIGQLAKLERLMIANTALETLPPELVNLTNLKELHLQNNHFLTKPAVLKQLAGPHLILTENSFGVGLTPLP